MYVVSTTLINDSIVKRFKQIIYMLSNYTYSKYVFNKCYNDDVKLISPYYFELISVPNKIDESYWEFKKCVVELNSLYFNFSSGPIPPTPVNYWEEVYADDGPFDTSDNKYYFVVWRSKLNSDWRIIKFKNDKEKSKEETVDVDDNYFLILHWWDAPKVHYWALTVSGLRHHAEHIWRENSGINYFKAVYRWNVVGEPNTPIIDLQTGQITDWNLKQQSIIKNNKNNNVIFKNKDISENHIYQLEANYFNWLSITNELETNNIPSLIAAEIKLSDGEYGKYLTNLIVSNDKIEDYLNYFSQWYRLLYSKADWISMTKTLVVDNIKITFYKHEKLFNLNQIEISGIWGYGKYDITIFTEKEQININNLELFNRNNEKLSLITLEI
ncbi:DUF3688 domain-containing protein [Spiroplasma citri]|uniref:DUF3688 family protein n=2 Tax=Spiroplasma citri TaxID=2133 RepID=UPI000B29AF71|nr:DUF3688 family protein [Spiroplasma citri]QIA67759.1 DUF3688 domain-containing protein [Spiroplasma citri]QIA71481.1 DUF3688 domain-containing protein [Spiroplasma citri]QIA73589.1 DUF3688 domain-containing protein [Spiroplasma citri]QIA75600.1 DUF3688 domain-containing protein [Spiroplasma citri]QJU62331.1 DUF3688 family protein [Spiroplasma citri]